MILALLRWLFKAPTAEQYEAASPGVDHTGSSV